MQLLFRLDKVRPDLGEVQVFGQCLDFGIFHFFKGSDVNFKYLFKTCNKPV